MVDGLGLYTYVRGNPVALSDPSGTTSDEQTGIDNLKAAAAKLAASSDPNERRWVIGTSDEPAATSLFAVSVRPGLKATSPAASAKGTGNVAAKAPSVSIDKLRQISAALQYHLTFPKAVMRVLGAAQAVGGLAEVGGAGVAFASPEPVASKLAGWFLLYHGSDQLMTGIQMIWSGEHQHTYTFKLASGAAKSFGADSGWQSAIGQSADIGANVVAAGASLKLAAMPFSLPEVSTSTVSASSRTGWLPAELVREIKHGEKLKDILEETRYLQFETGIEHGIGIMKYGTRGIYSGGSGGILWDIKATKSVPFHTHPHFPSETPMLGPSVEDSSVLLPDLNQSSGYVMQNGLFFRFRQSGVVENLGPKPWFVR